MNKFDSFLFKHGLAPLEKNSPGAETDIDLLEQKMKKIEQDFEIKIEDTLEDDEVLEEEEGGNDENI